MIELELFRDLFPDMDPSIYYSPPKSDRDIIETRLPSKLWRMNNLYTIIDKHGRKVRFRMNKSQMRVYAACRSHSRLIILKSRQQGISTLWLISFFDDALFRPNLNIGLMAQGQAEAKTLLGRVKIAWDELDSSIKGFLGVNKKFDNSEAFSLDNGSTIFVRVSFRSATLQRLHISEYGKIANKYPERAKETTTGTLQAIAPGNTVAIESTAEGDNDFKVKWDTACSVVNRSPKDFLPVFLSWLDDPDCLLEVEQPEEQWQTDYLDKLAVRDKRQRAFWVAQYRELGEEIYQEYPSTAEEAFLATRQGTYYARLYMAHVQHLGREVNDLWDPNLPVHVAMDLGMNDDFVMGFFQLWRNTSGQLEYRVIDEYRNSGEGLAHYVNIITLKNYTIGTVVLPHDVKVRELTTGMSRLAKLRDLGLRNYKVLPRLPILDGIEAVRQIIPMLWLDRKCVYIRACLLNYTKDWDDKLAVWKDKPLHNEYSHGADMLRMMAMSNLGGRAIESNRERTNVIVTNGLCI